MVEFKAGRCLSGAASMALTFPLGDEHRKEMVEGGKRDMTTKAAKWEIESVTFMFLFWGGVGLPC